MLLLRSLKEMKKQINEQNKKASNLPDLPGVITLPETNSLPLKMDG